VHGFIGCQYDIVSHSFGSTPHGHVEILLYRRILHYTTNCRFIIIIIIIIIIRRVHCMLVSEKPRDAPMFNNFVKSVVDDGFYGLTIRPQAVLVRY